MNSQRRDRFKKKRKSYAIEFMLLVALLALFLLSYLMYSRFATKKSRPRVIDNQLSVYRQAYSQANQTADLQQKRKIFAAIVAQYPRTRSAQLASQQVAKIDHEFASRKQECLATVKWLMMRQQYLAASYQLKQTLAKSPDLAKDLAPYRKSLQPKLEELVAYELQKAATIEIYGDVGEAILKIHCLQQQLSTPDEWRLSQRYRKILDQIRKQRKH